MTTTNDVGELRASENSRVQVGNFYNTVTPVPEPPETPPKPSFLIPFSRNNYFVERKTILDWIYQARPSPASRTALIGLGGVGKSQLVIEHAYRVRDVFKRKKQGLWVFWVHAATRARVEEGFKEIADAVKIRGGNQPQADILQLVYRWLSNENNGQWLMILDSADDPSVFYSTTQDEGHASPTVEEKKALSTYLPQSCNGSILITTRDRNLAFKLTGHPNNIFEVGPMHHDDSLTLLEKKIGFEINGADGRELVKALEFMPLAIGQAAAYIQQRAPRASVKDYLQKFQESEENQLSLLNHNDSDLRRDASASNSIITTWQISFDLIRSIRRSATDLLSLMSFFDCQGIQESLIQPKDHTKTWDSGFEEDIAMLRNFSLIKAGKTGGVFEMHGLVQLSTRKWLHIHRGAEEFKAHYIHRLNGVFPVEKYTYWPGYNALSPHFEQAVNHRPLDKELLRTWTDIMWLAGCHSNFGGRYSTAEMIAKTAVYTATNEFGAEDPLTTNALGILASIYRNQGRLKEAESLNEQTLEIRKRVIGSEHSDTLTSMSNLAVVYYEQGRLKEAELLNKQTIEIKKRVIGSEHPDTLTSMDNLALVYYEQGRLREAEFLNKQTIEISKRVIGSEHPNTLISIGNLALVYYVQGRLKEAEFLDEQILEMKKRTIGSEHPSTLTSMNNLACDWAGLGHTDKAIELMRECVQARFRVLGPQHNRTQQSLSALRRWCGEEPQLGPSFESDQLEAHEPEAFRTVEDPAPRGRAMVMAHTAWSRVKRHARVGFRRGTGS